MGELPDLAVIIIKNLVLAVVLNHVASDEFVVDDGWSNRLLIFLNLLLVLELGLDLGLHGRPTHTCGA